MPVELFAAAIQGDRVVDGDVASLEPCDDVLQLLLQLLERSLAPLAGIGFRRAKPGSAAAWRRSGRGAFRARITHFVSSGTPPSL